MRTYIHALDVLCFFCLVCLFTLLASFFLPSHQNLNFNLKHVHMSLFKTTEMQPQARMVGDDGTMEAKKKETSES